MGGKLVGTGDVHYLQREDYHHHTALLCVQTKSTLAAPKMTFDTNEFYLRSSEEMHEKFAEWPDAIPNTLEVAERCNVEIALGEQLIPRFLPEGQDEKQYLRDRVMEGMRARYGDPIPAAAMERMEFELGVIDKMGFNAYFLIVWDFVKWAKENGIAVGPGRGSAAGSIIAYTLRITDLDPLRYDLLFERFLNPERVSMPDIDIDFSVRGRERVMQYVVEKYGRELGRADHHLRQDVPARGDARRRARARPRVRPGRPPRQADPGPDHGPAAVLRRLPRRGRAAARRVRQGPDRQADRRRRQGPRGDRPQQLDPRGGGRHRGHAADRRRAAAARRRQRDRRVRQQGLPPGHPVLDEARRGARAAQDGLPGPAQPRRHRGRAGHHRPLDRRAAGHGAAAARRREDLRDARRGRLGRRVPVRVRRHAGGPARRSSRPSSTTSSRSCRSTARARWSRSRPTRAASATRTWSRSPTSAWSRSSARRTA